jgi:hypothetical protein
MISCFGDVVEVQPHEDQEAVKNQQSQQEFVNPLLIQDI